jgi:hypothetical protein
VSDLFHIEESLSPRLKWMQEHKVCTEFEETAVTRPKDYPWEAYSHVDDLDDDEDDPTPYYGWGATEEEAIVDFARKNNLRLWNETNPS